MPEGFPFSPDEVAQRTFATSFRGFDPGEVRPFLSRVAEHLRELEGRLELLRGQIGEAEERARHPQLDIDTLTSALGEETARILKSAQDAAHDMRTKAEENIAQLLREAYEEAGRIRAEAETVLARESELAEAAAEEIRGQAAAEAAAALGRAREEAERVLAEVEARARASVDEAEVRRTKVLGDLARRRRVAHIQVEQLRAGRERLLESYRLVRTTLDEVTDDLRRAEVEAREAAEEAARRVAEEVGAEVGAELGAEHVGEADEETAAAPVVADELAADDEAPVVGDEVAPVAPPVAEAASPSAEGPAAAEPPADVVDEADAAHAVPPAAPEAVPATSPPSEERRLSSLRILRKPKVDAALVPVAPPADEYEGVRIIKPEPVEEPPLPEEEAAAALAEPEPEPDTAAPSASAVDDLFARIRADRAEAVAHARVVLEEPSSASDGAPEAASAAAAAPEPVAADEQPVLDEDEARLQRRDAAVEDVQHRLARRLKRGLQDEQNDVLDRLRVHRGRPTADALLPAPDDHAARYREVAAELLQEAASAGAAFVGATPDGFTLDDLVTAVADDVVAPLRRRLERSLEEGADEDQALIVERIGAAYRETKGRRIEQLASDYVVASFSRATVAAAPEGSAFRWLVDDEDGPCPDCDDNALAGPTPKGEAYPTGQVHPPAHAGCRCLLVVAST